MSTAILPQNSFSHVADVKTAEYETVARVMVSAGTLPWT